jgi:dUTPase
MKLKVKKLNPKANIPTRAHHDDAGLDIYCCENMIIPPHTTVKVPTGIAYEVPDGYCVFAWDKGSLGSKGIKTLGGVLDSGYCSVLFSRFSPVFRKKKNKIRIGARFLVSINTILGETFCTID